MLLISFIYRNREIKVISPTEVIVLESELFPPFQISVLSTIAVGK